LCKLHGSVNFFQNNSKPDGLFIANDLGDNTLIGRSGVWKNKPAIFAVDAIWNIRKKHENNLTPSIIPPTYAKLTQQPWLREIWNKALIAMSEAKKIIFIGYSMPGSDGFIESFVHASMMLRINKGLTLPRVYAITRDSKGGVYRRYIDLFKNCFDPSVKAQTFSDAIENGVFENIFN